MATDLERLKRRLASERERNAALFERAPFACLITDIHGNVREANLAALALLQVPAAYLDGKPLAIFIAEEEREAFRMHLAMAVRDPRATEGWLSRIKPADGQPREVKIDLRPMPPDAENFLPVLWFLQELETTNEELQSSNEELETTNEDLRSTNEELETVNEELQSTNEALQTVNDQLRQSTDETTRTNAFLESVLGGLAAGAAVLDRNYNVLVWNHRAEDLWGLRADEVRGKSFLVLDTALPVAELRPLVRACLSGESDSAETTLEAINRRGKRIKCQVACTPLTSPIGGRDGVILLMEEVA